MFSRRNCFEFAGFQTIYSFYFDYTGSSIDLIDTFSKVGLMAWFYVVQETGEPGENHRLWNGDHYPARCRRRESYLQCYLF